MGTTGTPPARTIARYRLGLPVTLAEKQHRPNRDEHKCRKQDRRNVAGEFQPFVRSAVSIENRRRRPASRRRFHNAHAAVRHAAVAQWHSTQPRQASIDLSPCPVGIPNHRASHWSPPGERGRRSATRCPARKPGTFSLERSNARQTPNRAAATRSTRRRTTSPADARKRRSAGLTQQRDLRRKAGVGNLRRMPWAMTKGWWPSGKRRKAFLRYLRGRRWEWLQDRQNSWR